MTVWVLFMILHASTDGRFPTSLALVDNIATKGECDALASRLGLPHDEKEVANDITYVCQPVMKAKP